jgi:hypothetical protein
VLPGSDTPNDGTTQGATMHVELELLVEAVLAPEQKARMLRAFRLFCSEIILSLSALQTGWRRGKA